MTDVLTEGAERYMHEITDWDWSGSKYERVYLTIDGEHRFPIPKRFVNLDGRMICPECSSVLERPTWADGIICGHCDTEVEL